MKTMTVGEFKKKFSAVLHEVQQGESVLVEYGRGHRNVAVLMPYQQFMEKNNDRRLGLLQDVGTVAFAGDFAVSDEDLFGL